MPVELGNEVRLERVPDYVTRLAVPGAEWEHLDRLSPATDYVLLCPYDLVIDPGKAPPQRSGYVGEDLILANLAVWLANPGTDLRFQHVLHIGLTGRADLSTVEPLQSMRPTEPMTIAHFADARCFNETISGRTRQGPLWMALVALWGALTEGRFYSRYAQLWTALEALLGPRDGDAVMFRVSQNLAFFLADTTEERMPLFHTAKQAYGKRSKVVHGEGQTIPKGEHETLIHQAEDWLRVAVVRILRSPQCLDAFKTGKKRDEYFERLVFAEGTDAAGRAGA